jgi:WD40 repeat protein
MKGSTKGNGETMKTALSRPGVILLMCAALPAACRGNPDAAVARPDKTGGGGSMKAAAVEVGDEPPGAVEEAAQPQADMKHASSMTVEKLKEFPEKTSASVAFHPDGKRWYSASSNQLFLWKGDSFVRDMGALLTTWGHLAVSGSGRHLVGDRGALDLESGKPDETVAVAVMKALPSSDTGYEVRASALSQNRKILAASIQFRPPRLIVHTDDKGNTTYTPAGPSEPEGPEVFVALYDLKSGKETVLTDHHTLEVSRIYMHGDLVAYCDCTENLVYLWNVKAPEKPAVRLTSKYEPLGCVLAFTPDGSLLASARIDTGHLSVWKTGTGKLLKEWPSGRKRIESIAFHPRTHWLAAGDTEGHVDIWRFDKTGKPKTVLKLPVKAEVQSPCGASPFITEVRALHFSPDGSRLIVGLDLDGSHVMIYSVKLVE